MVVLNINYEYYKVFYYTAKYKNITQAAKALLSNQPNITRTIKLLEESLGCTLFVRSNRGVTLTPEGEKLYLHISAAFKHIQTGEEELLLEKNLQGGQLSISITEIALHCLMLPVLKNFRKAYPKVRIQLSNSSTPQALYNLKSGLSDIAVITSSSVIDKSFMWKSVKKFNDIAICSKYFSELKGKEITLKELSDYPLITTGKETQSYKFYSELFLKQGLDFNPEIEASTTDLILPMVKNDLGIGFVPMDFIENNNSKDLIILNLEKPIPARTIYIVKNPHYASSAAAKALENMIYKMYGIKN